MIRRPPRPTLFPYPTLFGSGTGYLLKSRIADVEEFLDAVQRIARGGSVVDPALVRELVTARRRHDPLAALSAREREVLELMARSEEHTSELQSQSNLVCRLL